MRKILVPVDGSPLGGMAVARAGEIAKKFGSQVTVMHTKSGEEVEKEPTGEEVRFGPGGEAYKREGKPGMTYEDFLRAAELVAEKAAEPLVKEKLKVKAVGRVGDPAEEILKVAKEGYDLIVIAPRGGISRLKKLFLGSVSKRVADGAPCSVLVVR